MCNRYTFQDWTTFATGDLAFWRRRRMEHHLAQCAECRAVHHSVQSVWNIARSLATEEVSPTMSAQIQSVIARETVAPSRLGLSLPRRALFGALGLTAALVLGTVPFLTTRSLPAFADVENAMRAVHSVRYRSQQAMSYFNGRTVWVVDSENVMRFSPAASASHGITHNLLDAAHPRDTPTNSSESRFGFVVYNGDHANYSIFRNHADPGTAEEAKEETLLRRRLWDTINSPNNRTSDPKTWVNQKITPWTPSRVNVGGQPLIRFERERDAAEPKKWRMKIQETVWTDPQTNLVVRFEMHSVDLDTNKEDASLIYEQFRYNENIPETAFQVPMPPEANLSVFPFKEKENLEISPTDRAAIQKCIAASDEAWTKGDFAAFAAVWDFEYLGYTHILPADQAQFQEKRRDHWENLVTAQRGRWKSWHTGIKKTVRVSILSGVPDGYRVEVFSNVRCAGRDDMHESDYTYVLWHSPNGWRIIDWNPYLESLNHLHDKNNTGKAQKDTVAQ